MRQDWCHGLIVLWMFGRWKRKTWSQPSCRLIVWKKENGGTYTKATRPKLRFRSDACTSQKAETSVLKLNFESRTVAPPVSSGSLFVSQIDFLRMEVKPFRFHKTERANNHIKHGDTLLFACNPIGVTYNRLPAMLTNTIHASLKRQVTCHMLTICPSASKALRYSRILI